MTPKSRAYLITGMPGSGKSSVIEELQRRGYQAVDTDSPEYSEKDATGEWILRDDSIRQLLHNPSGEKLFVGAIASNQSQYYPLFHKIFLLEIDANTITQRLGSRTNNDFGKQADQLRDVLANHAKFQGVIKSHSTTIDASQSLEKVVDGILEQL